MRTLWVPVVYGICFLLQKGKVEMVKWFLGVLCCVIAFSLYSPEFVDAVRGVQTKEEETAIIFRAGRERRQTRRAAGGRGLFAIRGLRRAGCAGYARGCSGR